MAEGTWVRGARTLGCAASYLSVICRCGVPRCYRLRRVNQPETSASVRMRRGRAANRGTSSMKPAELQSLFANLKFWHAQGWRAPNKPLLALWAIGRCLRNEVRLAPYDEIARELGVLLRRFGATAKARKPGLAILASSARWCLGSTGSRTHHRDIERPRAYRLIASGKGAQGGLPTDVSSRSDRIR